MTIASALAGAVVEGLLADPEDRADIIQETCERLWCARGSFDLEARDEILLALRRLVLERCLEVTAAKLQLPDETPDAPLT